jgi:hypothetical protein
MLRRPPGCSTTAGGGGGVHARLLIPTLSRLRRRQRGRCETYTPSPSTSFTPPIVVDDGGGV